MRRLQLGVAVGGLVAFAAAPRMLHAQGYGVYEHGTCVMGRAGTGVASPCHDGSTIFFNPAGLTQMTGQQIAGGVTLIAPSGDFKSDSTGERTALKDAVYPVPHLFYSRVHNDRLAFGVGLFVPYGLTTEWPTTFAGRFLGYKSRITAVYVQPTAAVKLGERLSLGAGFDLSFVSVELKQRVDLSTTALPPPFAGTFGNLGIPPETDFADAKLTGNATGVGYNLGLFFKATDQLSLGARYLSRQLIEIDDGEVEFSPVSTGITLAGSNPFGVPAGTPLDAVLASQFNPGNRLSAQGASTFLRLPEQWVVGAAFQVTPQARLLFDYQITNWDVFEVLQIDFELAPDRTIREDYQTSHGFRFGGEYIFGSSTQIRAGFLTHDAAAPDQTVTPNLPEGFRSEVTVGVGFKLAEQLRADLAYQYIDQAFRRGRTSDGGLAVPTPAVNNGLYSFDAQLFGATLSYAF